MCCIGYLGVDVGRLVGLGWWIGQNWTGGRGGGGGLDPFKRAPINSFTYLRERARLRGCARGRGVVVAVGRGVGLAGLGVAHQAPVLAAAERPE